MKDKVVVVTGAATGIGRAVATAVANEGAMAICADIDAEGVSELADSLSGKGQRVRAVECDVSQPEQVENLFRVADEEGGPNGLVCNAAIQVEKNAEDTTPEEWNRLLSINLGGVFLCIRAALPRMRAAGGGSIVNLASVNGFWVEPELAAYCTAKGGVINLTRSVAVDFGRYGIRCNCICPGYIDTGMSERYFNVQPDPAAAREAAGALHPLGRIGMAEEVAAMAVFLLSDAASFCTGAPFIVDGGLTAGSAPASAGDLASAVAQ